MSGAAGANYRAFGLAWQSALPLPEAIEGDGEGPPDVTITLGGAERPEGLATVVEGVAAGPGAFWMEVPGVAAFLALGGARVTIAPCAGADAASIRAFLLGSVVGAVLHQRGMLPLHASVVRVGGRVAAFLGTSGAGKSTLAAALAARGHAVLADDIAAVTIAGGRPCVWPGLRTVKLCADALTRQGRSTQGLLPVLAGTDKFQVPIGGSGHGPEPLAVACLLRRGAGDGGMTPLSGGEAMKALIANTFRGQLVAPMGRSADHFAQCAAVARHVPAIALARPDDGDADPPWAEAVEAHLRLQASAAPLTAPGEAPARAHRLSASFDGTAQ